MTQLTILTGKDTDIEISKVTRLINNEANKFKTVWVAKSAQEAVEKAKALNPHLVVLPTTMPGFSGFTATTMIKKAAPTACVILICDELNDNCRAMAYAVGADHIIARADMPTELYRLLETLIKVNE
jgi:DNA-binding NarL/FixJ family response regulator